MFAHAVQGHSFMVASSAVAAPQPICEADAWVLASYGRDLVVAAPAPLAPAGDVSLNVRTAAGISRDEWYRTRHAAAVAYLMSRGLDRERAWWSALALLGHWAHETGHGRYELDYALGNIRANSSWRGPVHYIQGSDDARPAPYRAYASLADGVADNASLAIDGTRYAPAFQALLASWGRGPYVVSASGRSIAFPMDVVQWYADLTRAGWHPYSEESQTTYRGTVTLAARSLLATGAAPVAAPDRVSPWAAAAGGVGVAMLGTAAWWILRRPRRG